MSEQRIKNAINHLLDVVDDEQDRDDFWRTKAFSPALQEAIEDVIEFTPTADPTEAEVERDGPIIPPTFDAPEMSLYGAVAEDAFKRAEHHEFDAAAYAVIVAFKHLGDPPDLEAWEAVINASQRVTP